MISPKKDSASLETTTELGNHDILQQTTVMDSKSNNSNMFGTHNQNHELNNHLITRQHGSYDFISIKTGAPKTYTFYQSTRNLNSTNQTSALPEKRQSTLNYQSLRESRKRIDLQNKTKVDQSAVKVQQDSTKFFQRRQNSFKKTSAIKQSQSFTNQFEKSQAFSDKHAYSSQQSNTSSIEGRKILSSQLVESTIIEKKLGGESITEFTIDQFEIQRKMQEEHSKHIQNFEEEYFNLREKFFIIEAENKMLENRNLDLVKQMLQSQASMRSYEQKLKKLQEVNKKNEDSLKISRNIISALNDKMVRLQKESDSVSKNLTQLYENKLAGIQASKVEALKASESLIFQLKLKIIDQNHALDEAVKQTQNKMRTQIFKAASQQLNQALIKSEKVSKEKDEKINQLKQELDKNMIALQVKEEELFTFRDVKQKEIALLKQKSTASTLRVQTLENAIEIYKKQKMFQDQSIEYLKHELAEKEEFISPSKKDLHDLQELDLVKEQLDSTKVELSRLYQTLDKYIKEKQQAQTQISSLRQELIDGEAVFLKIQSRCTEFESQHDILDRQCEEKDRIIAELNIKNLSAQLEIKQLNEKLSQFEEESVNMADSFDLHFKCNQEIRRLQQKLFEFEVNLNEYQQIQIEQDDRINELVEGGLMSEKEELINELKKSLLTKDNEIIALQFKLGTMTEESSKDKNQSQITTNYLTQQFNSKLEIQEQLKLKEVECSLFQSELECIKEQNTQLEKEIKNLQQQRFAFKNNESQKLIQLEEKIQQCLQREKLAIQELETLRQVLKQQQQDYYTHLNEEIKKFTQIQMEDTFPRQTEPLSPDNEHISSGVPNQQTPPVQLLSHEENEVDEWFEKINEHSQEELISKVQELHFVNQSLQMKVSELNQMEDNTNNIIMQKIRIFEEIIEKYEQEINQLQEQNQGLQTQNKELTQKTQFLQGKTQWLESLFKEMESNLTQTNEELLKSQAQIINLKLSQSIRAHKDKDYFEQIDEKDLEPEFQIIINKPEQSAFEETKPILSIDPEAKETGPIQYKELALQELKNFAAELTQDIEKDKPQEPQAKMQEPESLLGSSDLADIYMKRFMQGEYEVESTELQGVTYSIVVSHVESDDQYDQYEEKNQRKSEGVISEGSLNKETMDKLIESFADEDEQEGMYRKTQSFNVKTVEQKKREKKDFEQFEKEIAS